MRLAHRATAALGAAVVALAHAPGVAVAAPTADLARARAEYARSEYQRTVDILSPLVGDPRALAELSEAEAMEAHKLLGLSCFFLAQGAPAEARPALLDKAAAQFAALLFIDPDYGLDAALEGPDAVAYFDQVRRDGANQLERIRAQRRLDEERRRRPQIERVVERVERDEARWPNWLPGGVGQFRNGQSGKGAAILGLQAVTLGTSAFIYLSHATRYGWPVGTLPLDPDETARIRREQYVQIGAGVAFLVIYGYSVYDGYVHQQPAVEVRTETRPIRYDDDAPPAADPPPAAPPSAPTTSAIPLVIPLVTDRGLGATFLWEL